MRAARQALHWSADYVNLRWPGSRDCWRGLVRDAYRVELGIDLPRDSAGPGWRRVTEAQDFDLVLFRQADAESHVGLIAGWPNHMLHLPEGRASVVERFDDGTWAPRFAGLYRFDAALAGGPAAPRAEIAPSGLLSVRKTPFLIQEDAQPEVVEVYPGLSLLETVRLLYPAATEDQLLDMRVARDGCDVPVEFWREITRRGQVLEITPQPGAFPLGRLLAIVAIVTAAAFGQFYLGPLLATTAGFAAGSAAATATTAVTTAVLTTAAAVLVNSLIPPPAAAEQREVFTATGWENQFTPYGSVPMPAGYIRIAPPFCARPYIYFDEEGDMHLISLFLEGEGVLIKRKPRIGDTLIYKPEAEWEDPDVPEFNFEGLRIESREGRADDEPHTIYDHQVVDTDSMGVRIEYDGTKVVRAVARDCTQFQIILAFPNGLTGFAGDSGEPRNVSVFLYAEYRVIGDPDWIHIEELNEVRKQQQVAFFIDHTVEPAERDDFEVRIHISGTSDFQDSTGDYDRNVVQWLQLYGHRPEYPLNFLTNKATTAIDITATDQLQGILKSYNVEVSRELSHWDGAAWVTAESRSPADFARFIEQSANVCVKPKADAALLLSEYEDLAEFCEDNGLEYNETGLASEPLPSLRDKVLSAGRAQSRFTGTKLGLFIDRPQSVVMAHITPANGFQITREWERLPEIDGWIVSFPDETSKWVVKQRRVPFTGVENPRKWMTLDLPGKTSPDEVYVEAKRREFELTMQLNDFTIKASVGWEGLTFQRGTLAIADSGVDRDTMSFLVTAVNDPYVTINGPFLREAGTSYQARFRRFMDEDDEAVDSPPAESTVRNLKVTTDDLDNDVLILNESGGLLPEVGDIAICGPSGRPGRRMIISRIDGASRESASLTLLRYSPEIYEALDALVIPPWDGRVGDIIGEDVDPPDILVADVILRSFGVSSIIGVDDISSSIFAYARVTFTPFSDISHQMRWRAVGGPTAGVVTVPAGTGTAVSTSLIDWSLDYEVSVRSGTAGAWGPWTDVEPASVRISADSVVRASSDTIVRRA